MADLERLDLDRLRLVLRRAETQSRKLSDHTVRFVMNLAFVPIGEIDVYGKVVELAG